MAIREKGVNHPAGAEHPLGLGGDAPELEHLNTLLRASGASERDQCWIAYLLGAAAMSRMRGEAKPPGLDPILQRAIERGTMSEAHACEIDALADRLIEIGRGALPELDPAAIERLACNGEKY
jgi:hypothetical protein